MQTATMIVIAIYTLTISILCIVTFVRLIRYLSDQDRKEFLKKKQILINKLAACEDMSGLINIRGYIDDLENTLSEMEVPGYRNTNAMRELKLAYFQRFSELRERK